MTTAASSAAAASREAQAASTQHLRMRAENSTAASAAVEQDLRNKLLYSTAESDRLRESARQAQAVACDAQLSPSHLFAGEFASTPTCPHPRAQRSRCLYNVGHPHSHHHPCSGACLPGIRWMSRADGVTATCQVHLQSLRASTVDLNGRASRRALRALASHRYPRDTYRYRIPSSWELQRGSAR